MRALSTLSLLFAVLACCPGSANAQPMHMLNRMRRADSNLLGPQPVVRIPWQDLTTRSVDDAWLFRLTIDEQGHVVKSVVLEGPLQRREQAMALATALRFRPFVHDGRAEAVELEFIVPIVVEDYVGPSDRAFALASTKPEDVRIALSRTECFGSCPSYWLEVRGDGRVTYQGHGDVLVGGRHRWRVKPAAVAALVERFRQADYFKLKGYYAADVSDVPTYVTRLSLGRQQKFVLDYGGEMGDALEAPASSDAAVPRMPSVVTELENAIDAVAGADSWVRGDAETMAVLRKQNWNFRSPAAARGLGLLIRRCNTALATEFVEAGAPVNVKGVSGDRPVVDAARCGDANLIRRLESRGALARKAVAREFLEASVRSGYPELVAIALKQGADARRPRNDGKPLVAAAAEASEPGEKRPSTAGFNPAKVIEQLLAAGGDPDARGRDGSTALHRASSALAARALLRGGADPNARNAGGETPLFSPFDAEVKAVLVEAGADITARDHHGRTALFNQRWPDTASALLRVGANPNVKDHDGDTPLETADSESIVLMLMAAGAKLPTDPARLAALREKAAKAEWKQLPSLLAQAMSAVEGGAPPK